MPDLATLRGLRERVESGIGPDRRVDVDLWWELCATPAHLYERRPFGEASGFNRSGTALTPIWSEIWPHVAAPHYTASIDACVALVERLLPAVEWDIGRRRDQWFVASLAGPHEGWYVSPARTHPTSAPRALLSALLKALEAGNA